MLYPCPVFNKHLSEATMELYGRISWEWFFTGSSEGMSFDALKITFRRWRSYAAHHTGCQVGAMGAVVRSPGGNVHIHAMLVGKSRLGRSLKDVERVIIWDLEATWARMARSSCRILPAFEGAAARYIVKENVFKCHHVEELVPSNTKLLKKLMQEAPCL
jgi:hypothetical protein